MKRTKHQPLIKYPEASVFFGSWLLYAEFLKNGKGNYHGWSDATWAQVQDIKSNTGKQLGIPSPTSLCHYQATAIRVAHYAQLTFISVPNDAGLNFQK